MPAQVRIRKVVGRRRHGQHQQDRYLRCLTRLQRADASIEDGAIRARTRSDPLGSFWIVPRERRLEDGTVDP